jgi:hypothetical protein
MQSIWKDRVKEEREALDENPGCDFGRQGEDRNKVVITSPLVKYVQAFCEISFTARDFGLVSRNHVL